MHLLVKFDKIVTCRVVLAVTATVDVVCGLHNAWSLAKNVRFACLLNVIAHCVNEEELGVHEAGMLISDHVNASVRLFNAIAGLLLHCLNAVIVEVSEPLSLPALAS